MRARGRAVLSVVLALVGVTLVAPQGAGAEVPPAGEPSLFVVRAPVRHQQGVLTVRTDALEWFTDRPNRDSGELTAKELAKHWNGWGFKTDPPNAALLGDDVDVIGELTKPRVRGARLQFDFRPIRGELAGGNLGAVSLFIDPTSVFQYSLRVVNNSSNPTDLVVYQTNPETNVPDLHSLAWLTKYSFPDTTVTFSWDESSEISWGETNALLPGAAFAAEQTLPVNPGTQSGNSARLTYDVAASTFRLAPSKASSAPAGSIGVAMDATVPSSVAAYAFGQSGAAIFAGQARANLDAVFTPSPNYHLAFGQYEQGQVLDTQSITNNVVLPFPLGVTSVTATLNPDNTWTVEPA